MTRKLNFALVGMLLCNFLDLSAQTVGSPQIFSSGFGENLSTG